MRLTLTVKNALTLTMTPTLPATMCQACCGSIIAKRDKGEEAHTWHWSEAVHEREQLCDNSCFMWTCCAARWAQRICFIQEYDDGRPTFCSILCCLECLPQPLLRLPCPALHVLHERKALHSMLQVQIVLQA